MNDILHKPRFFILSIVFVLSLSLGIWSLLHDGKPFTTGGKQMDYQKMKSMRGERMSGSGRGINSSGDNRMGSGSMGGRMRSSSDIMTGAEQMFTGQ